MDCMSASVSSSERISLHTSTDFSFFIKKIFVLPHFLKQISFSPQSLFSWKRQKKDHSIQVCKLNPIREFESFTMAGQFANTIWAKLLWATIMVLHYTQGQCINVPPPLPTKNAWEYKQPLTYSHLQCQLACDAQTWQIKTWEEEEWQSFL